MGMDIRGTTGHVFIMRGSLTELACDAWLLPCDSEKRITSKRWIENDDRLSVGDPDSSGYFPLHISRPNTSWEEGSRTIPATEDSPTLPTPWLTDTAIHGSESIQGRVADLGPRLKAFLTSATEHYQGKPPLYRRARHLFAIPLIGSGEGGGAQFKGQLCRTVVQVLHEFCNSNPIDVALVMDDDQSFAAAQRARDALLRIPDFETLEATTPPNSIGVNWRLGKPEMVSAAIKLAKEARQGKLVIFAGAGLSGAAGLPDWDELLVELAEGEVVQGGAGLDDFQSLDVVDRAQIVSEKKGISKLQGTVSEKLISKHYGLGNGLIASLRLGEMVTTNYDTLIEQADKAATKDGEEALSVLPNNRSDRPARWLLKLHGCITRPASIVITREDYIRFEVGRSALAGVVQSLLLTRHMLFIGFSLRDENFHRIVDGVRRSVLFGEDSQSTSNQGASETQGTTERPFGTSIHLFDMPFMKEIWRGDVNPLGVLNSSPKGSKEEQRLASAEPARECEIFLDLLVSLSTDHRAHLMDETFDVETLSPEENQIRSSLLELVKSLSKGGPDALALESASAETIREMLHGFGWNAKS